MSIQVERVNEVAKKISDTLQTLSPVLRSDYIVKGTTAAWVYDGLTKPKEFSISLFSRAFELLLVSLKCSEESKEILRDSGKVQLDGVVVYKHYKSINVEVISGVKVQAPKTLCLCIEPKRFLTLIEVGVI